MPQTHTCIEINDEWGIVHARQSARAIAKTLGFGHVEQTRIATAISELSRNIYLYATRGKIWLEIVEQADETGLKITAKDEGPGIADIRKALEDGYTSSGGLGAGLPGVQRLMDDFAIDSALEEGTEIVVTKWLGISPARIS